MMPSIFTRIVHGEIPAVKVYEDADTLAFLDINPAARGHTLVICKAEIATLTQLSDAQLIATARTTQRVAAAVQHALNPDGINIMQNNGAAAGQTVFHYHVHIIPRWENDGVVEFWQHRSIDKDVMQTIADAIKHALA
jgi:histidine triad (HIT) family protein